MNEKQKMTQTQQVSEEDKLVFATEWDLYDTYRKLTSDADTETRLKGTSGSHNDAEIFQASECKRAVAIMQRLLASNNFHEEQALFMGLQKQKSELLRADTQVSETTIFQEENEKIEGKDADENFASDSVQMHETAMQ
ncbi:unnamed protein product [Bemisia tabaci]|nr:unnamed protein product [Bemisia tabaci]